MLGTVLRILLKHVLRCCALVESYDHRPIAITPATAALVAGMLETMVESGKVPEAKALEFVRRLLPRYFSFEAACSGL